MRNILFTALILVPAVTAQLRVTVYNKSHVSAEVRRDAFADLRDLFRAAGIAVELVPGDLAAAEASFINLPQPPRKGQEHEAACRARRDIALELVPAAPRGLKATILGQAEPLARSGLNARVYMDRVMDAAELHSRSQADVLAHVIAHEIGHVLLRSNQHTPRGLMSAVWTDQEYDWIARRLMVFTKANARIMRATLDAAGCVSASAGN